jgi:1-acyl-sn-glycerol-3-phosphate acyltransferase
MSELSPSPLPDPLTSNAHWRTYQFLLQNVFGLWLQYRARGMEHLPAEGGALLLINHQSFLDPLLVGLPLNRPISFLARDSLFRVPVVGWILRNTYVMPIDREAASTASLREALRRLELGFYVGVFPEGTRTDTGALGPFKPGVLALIRRSGVPVIPVGIAGAFESYPRTARVPWPGKVRVVFGAEIPGEELAAYGRAQDEQLLGLLRDRVSECQRAAQIWRDGARSTAASCQTPGQGG